jgi:hypothetical protein
MGGAQVGRLQGNRESAGIIWENAANLTVIFFILGMS